MSRRPPRVLCACGSNMEGVTIVLYTLRRRSQRGAALLIVLLMLLGIAGICSSLIWLMNQQQTLAGLRARRAAATSVAEAGVHRALAILEGASAGAAPGGTGPGRLWRPVDYTETLEIGPRAGRFSLTITDDADGGVVITSTGELAGATRRLRARTYLTSPALLVALYGAGAVRFQGPPTATYIVPYGLGLGDRPWVHIAAGREVWFARPDVIINQKPGPVEVGAGPVDLVQNTAQLVSLEVGPARIMLASGSDFTIGGRRIRVGTQQLRSIGLNAQGVTVRTETLPPMPAVDAAYYQRLAVANRSNAALNVSAGEHAGNADLARKRDSLYSPEEFDQIQAYLAGLSRDSLLRGVVYIKGAVLLPERQRLRISDGALITEGAIYISREAFLEVTHSSTTRALPGLVAQDPGLIVINESARVRIHGLVYASRSVAVDDGAQVDIVGALLAGDPDLSFRNSGGRVVIRYDPAVLGTPGMKVPAGAAIVGWIAAWEELP